MAFPLLIIGAISAAVGVASHIGGAITARNERRRAEGAARTEAVNMADLSLKKLKRTNELHIQYMKEFGLTYSQVANEMAMFDKQESHIAAQKAALQAQSDSQLKQNQAALAKRGMIGSYALLVSGAMNDLNSANAEVDIRDSVFAKDLEGKAQYYQQGNAERASAEGGHIAGLDMSLSHHSNEQAMHAGRQLYMQQQQDAILDNVVNSLISSGAAAAKHYYNNKTAIQPGTTQDSNFNNHGVYQPNYQDLQVNSYRQPVLNYNFTPKAKPFYNRHTDKNIWGR